MPKYHVKFVRLDDPSDARYVSYDAESPSGEKAFASLFAIPRISGLRSDWRIVETVECDPPLQKVRPVELYEQAVAHRIITKIRDGQYKPGETMPTRAVWAVRLGVEKTNNLERAIEIATEAGYLGVRSRQATYVLSPENWRPLPA